MREYRMETKAQLSDIKNQLDEQYEELQGLGLKLDMSRGKPSDEQVRLSTPMLSNMQDFDDIIAEDGIVTGNYGALAGIHEAKRFFANIMDVPAEHVFVGGNSSLNLMHDCISFAYIHGFPESEQPWKDTKVKFICPCPGYDRHFFISEHFGFELVPVDLLEDGPDMDAVEELVKDPEVKGMWSIPMYSNPSGITYSEETVRRLAALKPAAKDFRIFWDNAYAVHHLYKDDRDYLLPINQELKKHDNENMVIMFSSTSKITFPGGGITAVAASDDNLKWFSHHMSLQTISYDKLNQLRHVKFLPTPEALEEHMSKQAEILLPKFEIVNKALTSLNGLGIANWHNPKGGYFICLNVMEGCAKRVVQLCKEAGVAMTPAGVTHPYANDPKDETIRIAPTYPTVDELEQAAELLCLCIKLASVEKLLNA